MTRLPGDEFGWTGMDAMRGSRRRFSRTLETLAMGVDGHPAIVAGWIGISPARWRRAWST